MEARMVCLRSWAYHSCRLCVGSTSPCQILCDAAENPEIWRECHVERHAWQAAATADAPPVVALHAIYRVRVKEGLDAIERVLAAAR
jgi:hypothetical protein